MAHFQIKTGTPTDYDMEQINDLLAAASRYRQTIIPAMSPDDGEFRAAEFALKMAALDLASLLADANIDLAHYAPPALSCGHTPDRCPVCGEIQF